MGERIIRDGGWALIAGSLALALVNGGGGPVRGGSVEVLNRRCTFPLAWSTLLVPRLVGWFTAFWIGVWSGVGEMVRGM